MNVAYWPRFRRTSRTRSLPAWPRRSRVIRASRLRRARRNKAVNGMKPKLGIEPSRSSQPALADEVGPLRLRAGEVDREVAEEDHADEVVVDLQQVSLGRGHRQEERTMIANEKIVRTRMKML